MTPERAGELKKVPTLEHKITRIPFSGCWLWTGGTNGKGYGIYYTTRGSNKYIVLHRAFYMYYKGEIPDGLCLDHLCRVKCCVNPDHLEAVTVGENTMRGIGFAPMNAKKTHCAKGHEYSATNTHHRLTGGRECKQCKTDWEKAFRTSPKRKPKHIAAAIRGGA